MPTRLRSPRIESRSKAVRIIKGHTVTVPLSQAQRDGLVLIRERIQKGHELPTWAYRLNRDRTPDDLLEREGIMHLHLSPTERNATLFLIQYEDHVVFLGINDHSTFRDDPPGSSLFQLHANAIAETELAPDADRAAEAARKKEAVAAGLKPRPRPRLPSR